MNTLRDLIATRVIVGSLLIPFSVGFAEDPVVVHYSDPSLAKMEVQIGVTPAQRERFEDIIVKYRDPFSGQVAEDAGQGKIPSRGSGRRGGTRESGEGQSAVPSRGRKAGASRKELDELATILTPSQLKRFQELNNRKKQRQRPA